MKITIIGAGNMGGAIGMGLINKGFNPSDITMCDKSEEKLIPFSQKGTNVTSEAQDAIKNADAVIIAVKPNMFENVLPELTGNKDAVFITIAAGVSIGFVKKYLGNIKVIRVMPNTPAMIGRGVTAICSQAPVEEDDLKLAQTVFDAVGDTVIISEEQMDAVVSLNGSSPAYVYMMIDAMVRFGIDNGIDREQAVKLVCRSIAGAAEMALASDEDPSVLTQRVCSPGGTTIQAVNKLNEFKFEEGLYEAMKACSNRSREMTK